jgi:hypothetical protein
MGVYTNGLPNCQLYVCRVLVGGHFIPREAPFADVNPGEKRGAWLFPFFFFHRLLVECDAGENGSRGTRDEFTGSFQNGARLSFLNIRGFAASETGGRNKVLLVLLLSSSLVKGWGEKGEKGPLRGGAVPSPRTDHSSHSDTAPSGWVSLGWRGSRTGKRASGRMRHVGGCDCGRL